VRRERASVTADTHPPLTTWLSQSCTWRTMLWRAAAARTADRMVSGRR